MWDRRTVKDYIRRWRRKRWGCVTGEAKRISSGPCPIRKGSIRGPEKTKED